MINILSLGAGVQSTTMALMAAHGELTPMPDYAIFADTGAEPKHVYEQLDLLEETLPFPVHRVMHKDGLESALSTSIKNETFAPVPFFADNGGSGTILRRQCTREYKIQPIERKARELLGLKKGQRGPTEIAVSMWIGISADEAQRMKPSRLGWMQNCWPLIDKGMHRHHCLAWMRQHGFKEPKRSACYFCPFSSDRQWLDLKNNDGDAWQKALTMDKRIRDGVRKAGIELYLHRSRTPLADVDLDPDRDQVDMFGNECEGMCGV